MFTFAIEPVFGCPSIVLTAMVTLQTEIGKKRPFDEPAQELFLSLIRTAAIVEADLPGVLKNAGLSNATYNVLRILRGHLVLTTERAGGQAPEPAAGDAEAGEVACSQITRQLVTPVPDVTRLIDRLEENGLVRRRRSGSDRRVVLVKLTEDGLALLAGLDEPIVATHRQQFSHLSATQQRQLIELLALCRERPPQLSTLAS